jgi:hypothetical protein
MHIATVRLKSVSPYSQSRYHQTEKLERETADAFEQRTWRKKAHLSDKGTVIIPPMAFKNCISAAAKFIGEQVPGKGKKTYTKSFEAGIVLTDPMDLGIKESEIEGEWLFLPADGIRGSGKRVMKCYPCIRNWEGNVTFYILDPLITKDVFERTIKAAGQFIGIGRFRPINNGFYGRFEVIKLDWSEAS